MRLITRPDLRVCICGKILRPHEREQGCCDICLVLNRHLSKLPVTAATHP